MGLQSIGIKTITAGGPSDISIDPDLSPSELSEDDIEKAENDPSQPANSEISTDLFSFRSRHLSEFEYSRFRFLDYGMSHAFALDFPLRPALNVGLTLGAGDSADYGTEDGSFQPDLGSTDSIDFEAWVGPGLRLQGESFLLRLRRSSRPANAGNAGVIGILFPDGGALH